MALSLKLMNSGTLPGGQSRVVMVDGALTIGRGEENDLALPDPDRTLSKRHCVLEERNGDYVLIDISTNGTFLNYGAERLGTIPTPLNDGDVIQIGSYELVVAMDTGRPDPQHAAPLPPAPETGVMAGYQRSNTAGGDINDALDELDAPWDDILGDEILGTRSWETMRLILLPRHRSQSAEHTGRKGQVAGQNRNLISRRPHRAMGISRSREIPSTCLWRPMIHWQVIHLQVIRWQVIHWATRLLQATRWPETHSPVGRSRRTFPLMTCLRPPRKGRALPIITQVHGTISPAPWSSDR